MRPLKSIDTILTETPFDDVAAYALLHERSLGLLVGGQSLPATLGLTFVEHDTIRRSVDDAIGVVRARRASAAARDGRPVPAHTHSGGDRTSPRHPDAQRNVRPFVYARCANCNESLMPGELRNVSPDGRSWCVASWGCS